MRAKEFEINKFLSAHKTRFIIPIYQRNYDWSEEQCDDLFDDILKVANNNKTHFIGNIVWHPNEDSFHSGIEELVIIDGQQRITTITLIYLAIQRLATELEDEEIIDEMETYLINKYGPEKGKLKLRAAENNDKALASLLKNEDYPEDSNLIKNFNYFKGKITEQNYQVVRDGISKLIFVEIELERGKDEPQRIFESLNSKGLVLSQADLIRNYILMGLNQENQENIYTNYWEIIEKLVEGTDKEKESVSEYLRHYLTLVNKKTPTKKKVYAEFQKKYPITSIEELENNLKEIKRFAKYYNKLINPEKETDEEIRQQLKYISQLEITFILPFLMQVYADYDTSKIEKSTFLEVLELIESFFLRRAIVDEPSQGLNLFFAKFYDRKVAPNNYLPSIQKSLLQNLFAKFPTDTEVIEALKNKNIYNMRSKNYLLERLENFENTEKVLIENNPEITIEHIFPQSPDPQWEKELGSDECEFIEENYLHTIGNLTLSGNNAKLGNKPFKEKRDLAGKGYKDSRLWLNQSLGHLEKWDTEEIEKRCESLTKRFLQIWTYPPIEKKKVDELQEKIETFTEEYTRQFNGMNPLLVFYADIRKDYSSSVIDKPVFLKILELLQSYIVRKYTLDSGYKFSENVLKSIYKEIDKDNYLGSIQNALWQQTGRAKFPTDDEFVEALKDKDFLKKVSPLKRRHFLFEKLKNNEEGIEPEKMDTTELTKRFLEIWPYP